MTFSTPYVYVQLEKLEKNIQTMTDRLRAVGIDHWPHIKTHKSIEVARKQLAAGAKGITCATISEAEVFASAGFENIFIAYQLVGDDKLNRLKKLAKKVRIRTIVDSLVVAEGLSKVAEEIGQTIDVLIEIDGGSHRGGVQPGKATLTFTQQVAEISGLNVKGIFTYVGQIYSLPTVAAVKEEAKREAELLLDNKQLLEEHGIEVEVTSGGSTLSSYYSEQLRGITESRAGNYVFGDMNAVAHDVYTPDECALRVCATIVSVTLPGYATIDAGTKTLTSDLSAAGENFGYIIDYPDVNLVQLNEEHGYLRYDPEKYEFFVGDQVHIVPNHVCVLPNVNETVFAFRDGKYEGEISIAAKGKTY